MSDQLSPFFQEVYPAQFIRKTRNKITIPAFSVTCGDGINLVGHSIVVARFTYSLTKQMAMRFPLAAPSGDLFIPVIRILKSGDSISTRYKLWEIAGESIPLTHTLYAGQLLPATFEMEIWNIDGQLLSALSNDYDIEVSQLSNRSSTAVPTISSLAAPTINSNIHSVVPWTDDTVDFDQPIALTV